MISDEVFDMMRDAWASQIPEHFRCVGHAHPFHSHGAIIAPPPPRTVLKTFWGFFERVSRTQHLTADQLKAKAAHEKTGKPPVDWPAPSPQSFRMKVFGLLASRPSVRTFDEQYVASLLHGTNGNKR